MYLLNSRTVLLKKKKKKKDGSAFNAIRLQLARVYRFYPEIRPKNGEIKTQAPKKLPSNMGLKASPSCENINLNEYCSIIHY